ncbi:MAG: DUF2378 family protein [Anaeromyxobacteraceae bacterium]
MRLADARADLEMRKALATSDQVVRGALVQQVLEYVRERAGEEATRGGFARPLQDKALFSPVSALEFLELLGEALEKLAPGGVTSGRFYREIGRRAVFAIRDATIGRTMVSMSGGDPAQLFERLGSGPSILVAFGERRVTEVSRGRGRVVFTGSLLPPAIFAGMYCAMAEVVGARDVQCESTEPALGDTEHVITWSASLPP